MRVVELAKDLNVSPDTLLVLLRQMGIAVGDPESTVGEADVARVLARVEKERRAGRKNAREAVEAAVEDAQTSTRRRRRRRRREPEVEAAPEAAPAEETPAEEPEAEEAPAGADEEPPVSETPEAGEPALAEVPEAEEAPAAAGEPAGQPEEETAAEAPSAEAKEAGEPGADADEAPTETAAERPAPAATAEAGPEEAPAPDREDSGEPRAEEEGRAGAEPETAEAPVPAEAGDEVEGEAAANGDEDGKPQRVRRKPKAPPKPAPAASAGPGGKVRIQAEGYTASGKRKKEKKKGKKRQRVDQDAVQDNIQRVMAEIKGGGKKRRRSRAARQASREERAAQEEEARQKQEEEAKSIKVNEFLTAAELSELIDVPATEIVSSAFKNLGMMVTINQRLDFDQIELLLDEFGYKAERQEEFAEEEAAGPVEAEEDPEALRPRPPVVTVMGHVDHGKTLLLDYVRKTNVVAGESGGITQHIGAYHVETGEDEQGVTFLDTPGHAAFTAMRARGAEVTDIVVLMVAADDSIMPQTIEAISHAKNAGVPIVVAINKIDLPTADPNRVRQELLQHGVTVEEFGGNVLSAEMSAKTGQGVDDLLEKILLQAELLELKANPERDAHGVVIEAQLDVGKGPVVTVLVRGGTLRVGDSFVVGPHHGRVRALLDERGNQVEEAGPGIPVQLLGCPAVPQAGDVLTAMDADRATEIAQRRQRLEREKELRIKERGIKLGDFSALVSEGETSTLPLVIKGDVDGSVQAVSDALEQLGTNEVGVEIIHRAVGSVNESDVLLAQTAGAVIIGFRVRPDANARTLAEREGVDIHGYEVIYEAVDEVRSALEGMLTPEEREQILGSAEVRETFRISRIGTVAGCYVTDGVIQRNGRVRLIRDGVVVYTGNIASLKRFKDDVKEVREGFECGLAIENFNDVKVGDVIECFTVEEVARTLAGAGSGSS